MPNNDELDIEVVFRNGNYDDENPVYPFRRNAQGTIDVTRLRGNVYSYDRADLAKTNPFNMVFSPRFSFCLENLCIYEYEESSEAIVDGDDVIMPEGKVGRWLKYLCLGGEVPVSKKEFDEVQNLVQMKLFELGGKQLEVEGFLLEALPSDWSINDINRPGFIKNKPIIPEIPPGIVIDPNYTHTDNNFSNEAVMKLSKIENEAQVNKIELISVNGALQPTFNRQVNIAIPYADDISIWYSGDVDPDDSIGKVNDWYEVVKN